MLDLANEGQTVIFTDDEWALFETRLEEGYDLPPEEVGHASFLVRERSIAAIARLHRP